MSSKKSKSNFGSIQKQVKAVVKKEINKMAETKSHSSQTSSFSGVGSISGTFVDITAGIAQGVGDGQRIGNSVNLTKVHVQRVLTLWDNNSGADSVRIIVGIAKGRPLTSSDMPNYFSPCDLDLMYVLKDTMFPLSGSVWDGTQVLRGVAKAYDFTKKWKSGLTVQYDDATSTPIKNQIFFYMLAGTASAQQAGYATVYFKDM